MLVRWFLKAKLIFFQENDIAIFSKWCILLKSDALKNPKKMIEKQLREKFYFTETTELK